MTTTDGAAFGNATGEHMTDSDGIIQINKVDPGTTLVVKEIEALPGYVLDDTAKTVTVKSNETTILEFTNQPKGSLIILKKDSVTGAPLCGIQGNYQRWQLRRR